MPSRSPASSAIARLLRPDPFRELFRLLADGLPDAVLVLTSDGREVLAANHAFLLLTGHSRSDVPSLRPSGLFPEAAGEEALARILNAWGSADVELSEVPMQTRQGEIVLVDLQARAASGAAEAILIQCAPTGARQQAEATREATAGRLRRLTELTHLLLDHEGGGFAAIVPVARELLAADGVGIYAVSSSGPEYLLQGSLPADFPPSLPAGALDALPQATHWSLGQRPDHPLFRAGRSAGFTTVRTAPLGTATAWVGMLVAGWRQTEFIPDDVEDLMALLADIAHAALLLHLQRTSLSALEAQVQALKAESRDLAGSVSDGLISLDEAMRVVSANPLAATMLGYREGELSGAPIQDVLVGPEDFLATLLDASGHERQAERSRLILHRRDGTPFPVHLRVRPTPPGSAARLLLVLSDMSERQAIENQTEILAQRALLGEVSAIFAHEVRNPINNISTGVQYVGSRLGKDHPLYESLDRVRRECLRLDQLMTDVLFFARPLELRMETVDLAEMLQRLLARWQPRMQQAGVRTHTTFDPATSAAEADPRTLEQVIVNIITNAVQAMPEGGTLSLSLAPAVTTQGPMVELRIADTGPGIPPEVLDRIFDPFFTTKKDGTGLGLAISRRILAAHRGGIQVESFADAGTVFTIRLPAKSQPMEAPGP
ncbi:MAG TPA: ATP-binding protein [Anaerolineales bacterium]|nr:ATP-binding protein [Anaerolineales bacterium]